MAWAAIIKLEASQLLVLETTLMDIYWVILEQQYSLTGRIISGLVSRLLEVTKYQYLVHVSINGVAAITVIFLHRNETDHPVG